MKACVLLGHCDCPETVIRDLHDTVKNLILREGIDVFYVGTHGSFDRFSYGVLCQLEKKYAIKINVVLAYLKNKEAYYDCKKTIFPNILEKTPPQYAIIKRNHYMIDNSECMICYIDNSHSNAYAYAMRAKKKGLKIINLGRYKL